MERQIISHAAAWLEWTDAFPFLNSGNYTFLITLFFLSVSSEEWRNKINIILFLSPFPFYTFTHSHACKSWCGLTPPHRWPTKRWGVDLYTFPLYKKEQTEKKHVIKSVGKKCTCMSFDKAARKHPSLLEWQHFSFLLHPSLSPLSFLFFPVTRFSVLGQFDPLNNTLYYF